MNTLLIPTFNRPPTLSRLLDYLKDETFPILVLDSSSPYNQALNAEVIDHFCEGNVAHITFSEDTDPRIKWTFGLHVVWTPYVSFCADDDYVYPNAIRQCVAALERDRGATIADGVYMASRGNNVNVEYDAPSILDETSIARVANLLDHYNPMIYAVWRSDVAVKVFDAALVEKSDHFWELFVGAAPMAFGKRLRLPCVYMTREGGPPFEELNKTRRRWHPLSWTREDPDEIGRWFATYLDCLSAFTGLSVGELANAHRRFYADQGVQFDGANFALHGRAAE